MIWQEGSTPRWCAKSKALIVLSNVVDGTRGVGQGMRVDSRHRSIIVMNISGELSILSMFVMSVGLPATTSVMTTLSLGRSISTHTAVRPALLLLWLGSLLLLLGELQVDLLALHSTKFVGLRALAATAMRGTLLLEREGCLLDDVI